MEIEEKEFFHWQALDAKRKNKLLKVAISRINVEKEKEKESLPMLKEGGVAANNEKDTDTFLTGTNIEETLKEVNLDSIEKSQALVEQNLMENQKRSGRVN